MGTDSLGSDVFSRVVYGSRISVESALISVGLALLVGVPVGLVSGYFRGFWDEWVVMRVVDSIQAFPFLILALVIAAILGGLGLRDDRHRYRVRAGFRQDHAHPGAHRPRPGLRRGGAPSAQVTSG